MNTPALLANKNLIVNGEFVSNVDGWTLSDYTKGTAAQELDSGGTLRWHLKLVNEGEALQTVHVPVKPQPGVVYCLRFEFQSTNGATCQVVISPDSGPEQSYELVSSSLLDNPQPLVLYLEKFEQPIEFYSPAEQQVTIRFVTPANSGQPHRGLRVTGVSVEVQLPPLQVQSLKFDGDEIETTDKIFLCRGAGLAGTEPHRLSITPKADSPWLGSRASLLLDESAEPSGGVSSDPELGQEQPMEGGWKLICADMDEPDTEHSLGIRSEYTAEIYSIPAMLGHYRLILEAVDGPLYYPVVELDEDIPITVRVKSYYTQKPMAYRKVTWTLGGKILDESHTNAQGDATFTFKPDNTQGGLQTIVASVDSFYYPNNASLEVPVRVLLDSPWHTVELQLDEIDAALWGDATAYPNRGGSHQLKLLLPADHPLEDTDFALSWLAGGDSPQTLGVGFSPSLETFVPLAEASVIWTMAAENKRNGQYSLLVSCSRLKTASRLNLMKLAHNWLDKGETRMFTKYPVIDDETVALLSLQVRSQTIDADAPEVIVGWRVGEGPVVERTTGAGGWGEFLHQPKTVDPINITAQVTSPYDKSSFSHTFVLAPVQSNPWTEFTSLSMRDMPLDAAVGIVCLSGEEGQLKLDSIKPEFSGEWIHLEMSDQNPELDLVFDPPLGEKKRLEYGQALTWSIKSNAPIGGRFSLRICCEGVLPAWEIVGRVISKNFENEATLAFDQFKIDPGLGGFPCLGMNLPFIFQYRAGSALAGLDAQLKWEGQPPAELKIKVDPEPGILVELTAEGAKWSLDCRSSLEIGTFTLTVLIPGIGPGFAYGPFAMNLGHHRVDFTGIEHEAIIDPVVAEQERVGVAQQVRSLFTERPVEDVAVTWKGSTDGQATSEPSRRNGFSLFLYQPKTVGPHEVIAELESKFDGEIYSRTMMVKALASNVWDNVEFQFDSTEVSPWGEMTAFARRGQTHTVTLKLKDATQLPVNTYVQLGWRGPGATELGVTVDSALGTRRLLTAQGLTWRLTFSNTPGLTAGSFSLFLVAERVLATSPENPFTINASTSAQSQDVAG